MSRVVSILVAMDVDGLTNSSSNVRMQRNFSQNFYSIGRSRAAIAVDLANTVYLYPIRRRIEIVDLCTSVKPYPAALFLCRSSRTNLSAKCVPVSLYPHETLVTTDWFTILFLSLELSDVYVARSKEFAQGTLFSEFPATFSLAIDRAWLINSSWSRIDCSRGQNRFPSYIEPA